MSVTLQLLLYLAPAIITVSLAVCVWQNRQYRQDHGTFSFCGLLIILAYWSVCCTMTTVATTLRENIIWATLQYGGTSFVGPLWLLFAMTYADTSLRTDRRFQAFLFAPGILLAIAVLTNNAHMLWWTNIRLDSSSTFPALVVDSGPLLWLYVAYLSLCVLIGSALIALRIRHTAPTEYRHTYLMAFGAAIPVIGGAILLLSGQNSTIGDPALLLFTVATIFFFAALFHQPLPDINLIAQQRLLDNTSDGLLLVDHQSKVVSINAIAIQMLGLPSERWTTRHITDVLAITPLKQQLQTLLTTPWQAATQQITYTTNNELRGVELRLESIEVNQVSAGWLLVLQDTTLLTQAEQRLSHRTTELSVINQIALAIDGKTPQEDILPVAVKIIKHAQPDTWIGIGVFQNQHQLHLVHNQRIASSTPGEWQAKETLIVDQAAFAQVLQSKQTSLLSMSDTAINGTPLEDLLRKSGIQSLFVVPLHHDDTSLGGLFIGKAQDFAISTDERQLFDTIASLLATMLTHEIHDREVEQVSELKATFLATVSHELRTPLTSVMGFAHLLQIGVFGELPSSANEPLQSIQHHGEVLLRLINDILDFSRIEAEQLDIDTYPIDTTAIVESISNTFRKQAQERGLDFHVDITPDLPYAHANSTRLEQVLTHLLSNAIKFTEIGSITVRAYGHQELVRISIQDTGIGIAPEHQQRVFREFQQLEDIQTRRVGGAGLGLAISKRLMELMGGTITLESAAGKGSTFHCDLQSAAAECSTDDDIAKTRILG
ncbi:MAG: hypothetical protein GFH27_549293n53 [Chloroflexi bacterium AL-W]|nr:hypothetical protein [Chloroflexi bacterium AL-N1]NOK67833.1 hypothetical protein [Chloroflexi bacterium AL-N10]NOK75398.1 hypothetical protein [Chloroflexi bacterium AL-N5]NOK82186.1 hypothetical protein [Chloroflexi bacterium AL-W]NOK90031.1 hypothetical protein [Chloroflexi bacterium AL-N15]